MREFVSKPPDQICMHISRTLSRNYFMNRKSTRNSILGATDLANQPGVSSKTYSGRWVGILIEKSQHHRLMAVYAPSISFRVLTKSYCLSLHVGSRRPSSKMARSKDHTINFLGH